MPVLWKMKVSPEKVYKTPIARRMSSSYQHAIHVESLDSSTSQDPSLYISVPAVSSHLSHSSTATNSLLASTFTFRTVGALCMVFSTVEMGIGFRAYEFMEGAGAWWPALIGITAGFSALFTVTDAGIQKVSIAALVGFPIGAYGCYFETEASMLINSLVACGRNADHGRTIYYGNIRDFENVDVCMDHLKETLASNDVKYFVMCMCTDSAGYCNQILLNTAAILPKECGDLMTKLPAILTHSVAFVIVCTFLQLALTMTGICTMWYRRHHRIQAGLQLPVASIHAVTCRQIQERSENSMGIDDQDQGSAYLGTEVHGPPPTPTDHSTEPSSPYSL